MLKKLSNATKGYLITIFVTIFLALITVYFFLVRVKQIDSNCFNRILQETQTRDWQVPGDLSSQEEQAAYEAQLFFIIQRHKQCIEDQKFFLLF